MQHNNDTLQNFMDERDRAAKVRTSSPITNRSYDNTKERLSFAEEVAVVNNDHLIEDKHDHTSRNREG